MSKIGKACLLISGLFILASGVTRLAMGMWHDSLYVSLGIALVFLVLAVAKDHQTYLEFLTMRTTKHGMNMGVLILIVVVFLISINFIAAKNDKKLDWTSEGLNSLSEQSVKAAKAVSEDLKVILLSAKEQRDQDSLRAQMQQLVNMYSNQNSKISFVPYNARQRPELAQKYGFTSGEFGIFVEYKGKQVRVDQPTEEELTKALIKSSRNTKKSVYFTLGHGEPSIADSSADGLSQIKQELDTVYEVKELKLIETQKIPEDAAMIAIIGPTQQLLPTEMDLLRTYGKNGGHILVAADPGKNHNIAQLTKTFGVEFKNNYILDPRAAIPGMGNVAAIGTTFSQSSEMTRGFPTGSVAIFELASALSKAPDASKDIELDDVVRTDGVPLSTNQLSERPQASGRGPFTLVMAAKGKLPEASREFSAAFFGDSDFVANKLLNTNNNRDLFLNAISFLSEDEDLIAIRPKSPKGTTFFATSVELNLLAAFFVIFLPVLMFGSGGFIWWRRKSA